MLLLFCFSFEPRVTQIRVSAPFLSRVYVILLQMVVVLIVFCPYLAWWGSEDGGDGRGHSVSHETLDWGVYGMQSG